MAYRSELFPGDRARPFDPSTCLAVGPGHINNLDVTPTSVKYNNRIYDPGLSGSTEYAAMYYRMDHSVSQNVLGLYFEIDGGSTGQSQVGGSAIKIIQKGLGDGMYIALLGTGASGYGYEAAMFGGEQVLAGGVDKQENGFLGSFQGSGGFSGSRKKQSNSIAFHALVHDNGVDPTSPDEWTTSYALFYANNSLNHAFGVRCSQYADEYAQIYIADTDLRHVWEAYTSGAQMMHGAAATSGATTKNSPSLYLRGYYWTGGASTATQSRLVNKSENTDGKSSLYVYCGPAAGDTLIGYFSNIADGTNAGLNLQNNVLYAVGDLTGSGATANITNFQDASFLGTTLRIIGRRTVTNAGDAGNDGDFCFDTNYVYFCIGASSWKRAALSAW